MSALFFYGTLCHIPVLETVLGESAGALDVVPATLAGHAVFWAQDQSFPVIVEAKDSVAEGVLVRGLSAAQIARLDFYEGGFGYDLRAVTVLAAGQNAKAQVYYPEAGLWDAGAPWRLPDWVARFGAFTLIAAQEAMALFGKISAQELVQRFGMIRARATATLNARQDTTAHDVGTDMGRADVDIVSRTPLYEGFFKAEEIALRHKTFAGPRSELIRREMFVATDAAIVLPYDPRRDVVLLIEQFRPAPYLRGDAHPWMLEPIAGRVDGGETPQQAAKREAQEEAGISLQSLEKIAGFYPSAGTLVEYYHCYLGLCDLENEAGGYGGLASEAEDIKTHVLGFDSAMDLLTTGEAQNGPLILMLLWLAQQRPRLRASA